MSDKPILFSGPMVRAILEGRKTQTRRVVKCQPPGDVSPIIVSRYHPTVIDRHGDERPGGEIFGAFSDDGEWGCKSPFGEPGDRLWVRETWAIECLGRIGTPEGYDCFYELRYRADGAAREFDCPPGTDDSAYLRAYDRMRGDWWPSIHMPHWASRITLDIIDVRVERLNDCSEDDARAEGSEAIGITFRDDADGKPRLIESLGGLYRDGYRILWEQINGAGSWDVNPWVWVIEFKKSIA